MANGNVAQSKVVDNLICLNSESDINGIRARLSEIFCYGDYSQIVSDEYARRLREEFIPELLAQLDYNDLEAVRRLCEGMATHSVKPWVIDHAGACFEVKLAEATKLYHEYHS
jgi:hypothetical protein